MTSIFPNLIIKINRKNGADILDYNFNKTVTVSYYTMKRAVTGIFLAHGMDWRDAEASADTLVNADARGVYSHGCMRTAIYCRRLREGGTSPTAKPEITRSFGATALVDAHGSMGQISSIFATNLAIDIAKKYGCATVSVRGSNHHGACAYYALMAARADMLAFVGTVGCVNIMAPWGGTERRLGNNPFAVAAPCLTKPAIVLDMAQSVVARGKIVMARKTNSPVPETWALDRKGKPTTDAEEAYWGTVRPIGDYKGYGLSFLNAVFSGILPNASFGSKVSDFYELPAVQQNDGHLIYLINIDSIDEREAFKKRMDDAIDYLKSSKKAQGVSEILVPGEPEAISYAKQMRDGITYPVEIVSEIRALCSEYGVAIEKELVI